MSDDVQTVLAEGEALLSKMRWRDAERHRRRAEHDGTADMTVTHLAGLDVFTLPGRWERAARVITGIASTPTPARSGIMPEGEKASLSSAGAEIDLPIPLLVAHEGNAATRIGDIVQIERSEDRIDFRAVLLGTRAADFAWALIEDGTLRAVSVLAGDQTIGGVVDGVRFADKWRLKEISVCRYGANPDCRVEYMGAPHMLRAVPMVTKAAREPEPSPLPYGGVFTKGVTEAKRGQFFTHRGSIWHCDADTDQPPPGDQWTLAVKAGRDAKGT